MPNPHATARSGDRLDEFIAAPRRAVWTMAIPMMAGMAVHSLYVIGDTAFIGNLGTAQLAAATFVGPLFFIMITMTMGMSTAVTALVAQAVGRREAGGGDAVAGTAMTVGLALGVMLSIGGLLGGERTIALLGADGPTAELGWQYFQIICLLVPFFFVSSVLRAILTGEGDARTPTVILTISTAINLSFDALFIYGLDLGLRGAALATATAQLFSLTAFWFLVVRRRDAYVRLRLSELVPKGKVLWQIAVLGVPTAAGMMVMSLGAMALNRALSEFGEAAVAGYGAANKVDMIVGMPIFGLAAATVTVVGMFAGAGRADLIRSTALYTYRWALTMALSIGAVAYLASPWILRIFTDDPASIEAGRTYLGFMIFAYPMMAVGMTTGRLLQGLGHGVPSLVITSVRVLLVAVPAAYLAVFAFGTPVEGIWASLLLGGGCATVLSILWVRHLVWKRDPTNRSAEADEEPQPPAPLEDLRDSTPAVASGKS